MGRALEGRRDEAFVATKVLPIWPTAGRVEEHGRLSALRLGVECIDLYQVHWPNPLVSLRSTMAGMRRLQDAGIVHHVGVSNFSADRWASAETELGRPVATNQVHFSLLYRKPDDANVSYAQAQDRVVIAYSPLEQGVLGGRYDATHLPPGPARRNNPLCLPENLERATPLIETLRRVATRARCHAGAGGTRLAGAQTQRRRDTRARARWSSCATTSPRQISTLRTMKPMSSRARAIGSPRSPCRPPGSPCCAPAVPRADVGTSRRP